MPRRGRLLAGPGHQEDVVVDPQGDQEDEGEQDEVEGDPARAEELGEGEGDEAEGRREGGDDGDDQVAGCGQGAQDRDQDQADDEQDHRHDQLGVAGVGLLDVVVLGRDAADEGARRHLRAVVREPP